MAAAVDRLHSGRISGLANAGTFVFKSSSPFDHMQFVVYWGAGAGAADTVGIEVSTDGGTNWAPIDGSPFASTVTRTVLVDVKAYAWRITNNMPAAASMICDVYAICDNQSQSLPFTAPKTLVAGGTLEPDAT